MLEYNPGGAVLSSEKFYQVRDDILHLKGLQKMYYTRQYERIRQHLLRGDTQPALVISLEPVVISAYSDELDAVLLLRFPDTLLDYYRLTPGMRLVTSNTYDYGFVTPKDIKEGAGSSNRYANVYPLVQFFLCENEAESLRKTDLFSETTWQYVQGLTDLRLSDNPRMRDGFSAIIKFDWRH